MKLQLILPRKIDCKGLKLAFIKYWGNELVIDVLRMKDNGTLDDFRTKLYL
jgi:hypothetical protein